MAAPKAGSVGYRSIPSISSVGLSHFGRGALAVSEPTAPPTPPVVLIVDDDPAPRRLVRLSLEVEGAEVVDADSVTEARGHLRQAFDAFVLDRELPDGDGLDLLPDRDRFQPGVPIVFFSNAEDHSEPPSVKRIEKGDLGGLIDALANTLSHKETPRLAVI